MMKKLASIFFHRLTMTALLLVVQLALLLAMMGRFSAYFVYFYWFCIALSVAAVVWIGGT